MADRTTRFDGKVALVTGVGSGIGRAIAARLADEGASVFAVDVVEERLESVADELGAAAAVRVVDVADRQACVDAVAACVERFGRLDVLGNVAGIYLAGHATDITEEQYRRVLAVNLDGPFFLSQAAIPHLLAAGGGNIVNIASNSGLQGIPYSLAYAISKGGVVQLTRALAVEYLKRDLRVNAIAPAGTNTNIAATAAFPDDLDLELMTRMAGLRGMAEPEEVAGLFAFPASSEARSVTGAVYTLDNGLTAS